MVLTRLSHVGEICPLSDHSYSDPIYSTLNQASSSRRGILVAKSSPDDSAAGEDQETSAYPNLQTIFFLDFPTEILEKIFCYLSYKNIGEIRKVCRRFDRVCCGLLNSSFQKLQNLMLNQFQATKSQMPRRESARRKHPLARESDILETLHMRLTLLQMTFGKHIERKHCCFFAGDILDEVYRILRNVKSTQNLGKTFKITDELFDLSTMAMEYFKERIEPSLPEISYFGSDFLDLTSRFSDGRRGRSGNARNSERDQEVVERDPLPPSNMVLRKRIRKIRQGMRKYNRQLAIMKKEVKSCRNRIGEQNKQIMEYIGRLEDCDKKIDDTTRKLSTVLQELNKCKTELHYWRSKSPVHPPACVYCHCKRLSAQEQLPDATDMMWVQREDEDPNNGANRAGLCLPGLTAEVLSPQSFSIAKNLGSLFDLEPTAHDEAVLNEPSIGVLPYPSTHCDTSTLSLSSAGELVKDHFHAPQKRSSSDDDTDTDIDTVGRRVKERKRIKIDCH